MMSTCEILIQQGWRLVPPDSMQWAGVAKDVLPYLFVCMTISVIFFLCNLESKRSL
ncbi:hypothetical protein M0R19_07950 [Candidatus Pacearchaeota archaeon]|jgi:hypothetical protein|nr:hypothetical protein [Candidatus Pacearchaeota archaeon]